MPSQHFYAGTLHFFEKKLKLHDYQSIEKTSLVNLLIFIVISIAHFSSVNYLI